MKTKILKAYKSDLASAAKFDRRAPRELTMNDDRIAAIAASYTEADLRHAVVMRAVYERSLLAKKPSVYAIIPQAPEAA